MVRSVLLVMALLSVAVGEARADPILYSNGPINGSAGAYLLNFGHQPSDSFTLAYASNLTSVQLGLWTDGPTPATVQWSIGTTRFGSDQGSGTANLTSLFHNTPPFPGYSVFSSTFPLNMQLGSGTYWLTIQNGTDPGGSLIAWDSNSGPSSAFLQSPVSPVPSESFQIFGTIATPEPASITLLGIGIAAMAGYGWRSRAKNRSTNAAL